MDAGARRQVDRMIKDLELKLGFQVTENFLFEPTRHFYTSLEKVEEILPLHEIYRRVDANQSTWTSLEDAAKQVITHLNRPGLGIAFSRMDSQHAGLYHDLYRKIQISEDFKGKAFQLGAILAHEITHDLLSARGVWWPDTAENERYTEIAVMKLGLGKLYLNGIEERGCLVTKKIGYLPFETLAYAYVQICRSHHCDARQIVEHLIPAAKCLVESVLIDDQVRDARVLVREIRESLPGMQHLLTEADTGYARVCENQQVFLSRGGDIQVDPDDSRVLVDITNCLQFEAVKAELAGLKKQVESVQEGIIRYQVANEMSVVEWQILQLRGMRARATELSARIEVLIRTLQAWLDVQCSYLVSETEMKNIRRDLREIRARSRQALARADELKGAYQLMVRRQERLKARCPPFDLRPDDRGVMESIDRLIALQTFEETVSSCKNRISGALHTLPAPGEVSPRLARDLIPDVLRIRQDIDEILRISEEITGYSSIQLRNLPAIEAIRERILIFGHHLLRSR